MGTWFGRGCIGFLWWLLGFSSGYGVKGARLWFSSVCILSAQKKEKKLKPNGQVAAAEGHNTFNGEKMNLASPGFRLSSKINCILYRL